MIERLIIKFNQNKSQQNDFIQQVYCYDMKGNPIEEKKSIPW